MTTITTSTSPTTSSTAASSSAAVASTAKIPEETAGPFPGDGSNGVNVLTESGIVSDRYSLQLATVTGDVTSGMTATLNVPV